MSILALYWLRVRLILPLMGICLALMVNNAIRVKCLDGRWTSMASQHTLRIKCLLLTAWCSAAHHPAGEPAARKMQARYSLAMRPPDETTSQAIMETQQTPKINLFENNDTGRTTVSQRVIELLSVFVQAKEKKRQRSMCRLCVMSTVCIRLLGHQPNNQVPIGRHLVADDDMVVLAATNATNHMWTSSYGLPHYLTNNQPYTHLCIELCVATWLTINHQPTTQPTQHNHNHELSPAAA